VIVFKHVDISFYSFAHLSIVTVALNRSEVRFTNIDKTAVLLSISAVPLTRQTFDQMTWETLSGRICCALKPRCDTVSQLPAA